MSSFFLYIKRSKSKSWKPFLVRNTNYIDSIRNYVYLSMYTFVSILVLYIFTKDSSLYTCKICFFLYTLVYCVSVLMRYFVCKLFELKISRH